MIRTAYIALGSNISPETNLRAAVQALRLRANVLAISRVYRTPPWGYTNQPDFLNAVLSLETDLEPPKLLELVQRLERRQGRTRSVRYGPRTLDLDIVAMEGLVLRSPQLMIPHAAMHERAFVLLPLCDIAPEWRHPVLRKTARDLLADVSTEGIVRTDMVL